MKLNENELSYFISADWSKRTIKRAVYVADVRERHIRKEENAIWNVDALLGLAKRLQKDGPVLIGVDVVLGVPDGYWQRMVLDEHRHHTLENFVDWLRCLDPCGEFFETVYQPDNWRVERPWFKVPKGKGGLTSFANQVECRMLRRIDAATGAKPVFAVAGIPGTVGSGTRDFWKELVLHLQRDKQHDRDFAVWPFEGDMTLLLKRHRIVLCETYPALAYAEALPDELPPGRPAKTKRTWRDCMCNRLIKVYANRICLGPLDALRENEDDFDAHVTAVAFLRCIDEGREIASREWIDPVAEGSMLLAGRCCPPERQ